jgi:hypothetical protein
MAGWEQAARRIGMDYGVLSVREATYDESKDPTRVVVEIATVRRAFRLGWYAGSQARDQAESWTPDLG